MLLFEIISLVFLLWLGIRLQTIHKHDKVLYALCDYRRELTALLRNTATLQAGFSQTDYLETRKILDVSSQLIKLYADWHPSDFHVKNFLKVARSIMSNVEKIKKTTYFKSAHPSVMRLRSKFASVHIWALWYSLPILFRFSLLLAAVSLVLTKLVKYWGNDWLGRIANSFAWLSSNTKTKEFREFSRNAGLAH